MYSFSNRVRYSEVNSEKELTLPSLLDYLQDCCTFESEDFGVGVDYLAKEQVAWILSSWEIKVYRYPQMGQHIKVSTWPYAFRGFYGYRNFRIEGEDGEIFAEANSVWVFMDTEKIRPARVSERMQEVYIPEIRDEIPGEWADRKISLPDDVTSIGKQAFYQCEKLQTITLPSALTQIGDEAFSGCLVLGKIKIP